MAAFNIYQWIEENREKLQPPVGNQQLYTENEDFIVMVVAGPNARKDYHINQGEEFFFQLSGDINLAIIEDGKPKDIPIKEGEIYLHPSGVPHCPQRPKDTIGLVIERYRKEGEKDGFVWYCENCQNKLHETYFTLDDIVKQLPLEMENFYSSTELRTCDQCGTIMDPPPKIG